MTNEQLVISAKKGDLSAIEQLYTQNSGIIFRNCRPFERLGYETDDLNIVNSPDIFCGLIKNYTDSYIAENRT